uniref:Uncharacterized protein n=1 Tax=Leersia perrieri TaxID=77586 RepID=A0A0D9WG30_9ORYZ
MVGNCGGGDGWRQQNLGGAEVKKGCPWTPEEDLMLVVYIQDHGPRNWRAVPTNTARAAGSGGQSNSGRGSSGGISPTRRRSSSFTSRPSSATVLRLFDDDGFWGIIWWAAIASYLMERTDNDIKNYWNTHLKKKLKRMTDASTWRRRRPGRRRPRGRGSGISRRTSRPRSPRRPLAQHLLAAAAAAAGGAVVGDVRVQRREAWRWEGVGGGDAVQVDVVGVGVVRRGDADAGRLVDGDEEDEGRGVFLGCHYRASQSDSQSDRGEDA